MQLFISGQIQSVVFWKLCVPSPLNTVELLLRSHKGNKKNNQAESDHQDYYMLPPVHRDDEDFG